MTGGFKINGGGGGGEFLKILINGWVKINGGLDFSEKLNNLEGQQSRDHTI